MSALRRKAVALFCGCGGLALGFRNAGFEIVAAFDNWEPALSVFRRNFPGTQILNRDLGNLNGSYAIMAQYDPYVIIGGPPCQDYSHAGKRNEDLGRADLTVRFAEIVAGVRPLWFAMENVDQIVNSQRLMKARDTLRKSGYGLTEKILNASLCGVPQIRKRYFMVGRLDIHDGFLSEYLESKLAIEPMSVRQYMGDILNIEHYYRHPRTYGRRAIFSIDEPSPTIRGVNRPIPKNYRGHPGDKAPISTNVRPLTTSERSYVQTFPKDFIFEGAKTDLEQMIGNAVPVKLAEFVAESMVSFSRKHIEFEEAFTREERQSKQHQLSFYDDTLILATRRE